jgi:hypothetical protein
MVTKETTTAPKQGGKKRIESILALPEMTRKGNSRIITILYLVYPKMRLTSTKQIRHYIGDMEGIVTICLNVSQRKQQRVWNWLHLE